MGENLKKFLAQDKGVNYFQIKDSHYRRGCYIPHHGWKSHEPSSTFIDINNKQILFNEKLNFSCSEIGQLASKVFRKPKNNIYYFVFGYASYVLIKRPCTDCKEGHKKCACELILKALQGERTQIKKKLNNKNDFFEFNLARDFDVKRVSKYGRFPNIDNDKFTESNFDNYILVSLLLPNST